MRPYRSVQVGFENSDYDSVCETYGGGVDRLPAWRDLGDLLAHRPGWHFDADVTHGEALWSLGLLGESRLNVHVDEAGQYVCYDHAEDVSAVCVGIPVVEKWLSGREDEARKPSGTLLAYACADNWGPLKRFPHRVRVTWSDGYFSASMSALHDASFGHTLADVLNAAGEMLCRVYGAPADLASQLTIAAEVDETASTHVRSGPGAS